MLLALAIVFPLILLVDDSVKLVVLLEGIFPITWFLLDFGLKWLGFDGRTQARRALVKHRIRSWWGWSNFTLEMLVGFALVVFVQRLIFCIADQILNNGKLDFLGLEALIKFLSAPYLFIFDIGFFLIIHLTK